MLIVGPGGNLGTDAELKGARYGRLAQLTHVRDNVQA
jgi:hypothetical protein